MNQLTRLLGLCVLLFVLIGCSSNGNSANQTAPQAPPSTTPLRPSSTSTSTSQSTSTSASASTSSTAAATSPLVCPVTLPNGSVPPNQNPSPLFYGNGSLWTSLWSQGTVVFGPKGPGQVGADGSISVQWPWWRGTQGNLAIDGKRMDATAPPVKAIVPDGFGATGFQPTTLVFSSEGCWQITGRVGDARLTFVTLVAKTK
jgi:hypothetical protein